MSELNLYSATEQPDPTHNDKPACWDLVIQDYTTLYSDIDDYASSLVVRDMTDRDQWGRTKYKTPLQPFNGRDALVDFYQELLDSSVYLRQYMFEQGTLGGGNDSVNDLSRYRTILGLIDHYRRRIFDRDSK